MNGINKDNYVLIMAGGVGSRFWPKSRANFPKQFIDIFGLGKSLLQLTYERFLSICIPENIFILTNENYASLVAEQLPAVLLKNILLEPSRNNTAPCIAYASYKIFQTNPIASIVVAPSDHLILKEDVFLNKIERALTFVQNNDALVTLGIAPTRPDTGYGYIKFEAEQGIRSEEQEVGGNEGTAYAEIKKVTAFMEKPSLEKAEMYLASKDHVWNAGIFIWSVKAIIKAFEKFAPEVAIIFKQGENVYNTEAELDFIKMCYPTSPNISIDYAILEKANNVFTIPCNIGWSDLGTWASLHGIAEKDTNDNAVNATHAHLIQTTNCLIQMPKAKAVVIKGLTNYIVVDDNEVLLIYPKVDEQEIKQVASEMVSAFGERYL